jgi:hypothetical protein
MLTQVHSSGIYPQLEQDTLALKITGPIFLNILACNNNIIEWTTSPYIFLVLPLDIATNVVSIAS